MGEVLFYQLSTSTLERALPEMLERSLSRGWRAVVRTATAARVTVIDEMLWTYDATSFLPHGTDNTGQGASQPVYLTHQDDIPNGAKVLMLVDGARVNPAEVGQFDRVCLIFNSNEPGSLDAAREDWKAVREAGLTGKYWAQDDGRWVEKAST